MAQKVATKKAQKIAEEITELFATEIIEIKEFRGQVSLTLKKEKIKEILKYLKEEKGFNHLQDLCGVDYFPLKPRFEVVYNLYNIQERIHLRLKAKVDEESAQIDSIIDLWQGADWHERECFDMFGISFTGHPYLKRILMPEDWNGYPLRKDYPLKGKEIWKGFREILEANLQGGDR
ncbi:MAG: NADH-quinone oxidoreductase subunit C [Thermodesulfovibrionales bacterium]|nr:NADH-quinone oxidoreductase subunit C [Thermodesulfovibrionales bacterium]